METDFHFMEEPYSQTLARRADTDSPVGNGVRVEFLADRSAGVQTLRLFQPRLIVKSKRRQRISHRRRHDIPPISHHINSTLTPFFHAASS
jgi:hypothetical protein